MNFQFIAHRGASHDAPENTLAAIQLAWEQGA
ncbi:MAG: glycerophosphodiester phosphodiesterase family protein, partial [Pirellulales bacterium]